MVVTAVAAVLAGSVSVGFCTACQLLPFFRQPQTVTGPPPLQVPESETPPPALERLPDAGVRPMVQPEGGAGGGWLVQLTATSEVAVNAPLVAVTR